MAEKEYIDRDAALKIIDKFSGYLDDDMIWRIKFAFKNHIPAADVEPVRHGKWIYNPNGMDFNLGAWECSACAQRNNNLPCNRNISPYICVGSKYCPNCGAKMGGGEGE